MPYAGGEGRHKVYGMRSLDEIEGLEDACCWVASGLAVAVAVAVAIFLELFAGKW